MRVVRFTYHTSRRKNSAALYRGLAIPPDEPYALTINHRGIRDREFYAGTAGLTMWGRGRICREEEVKWTREVTQDYAVTNIKDLVNEIAAELFTLFDFVQVDRQVLDQFVDKFLVRKS